MIYFTLETKKPKSIRFWFYIDVYWKKMETYLALMGMEILEEIAMDSRNYHTKNARTFRSQ